MEHESLMACVKCLDYMKGYLLIALGIIVGFLIRSIWISVTVAMMSSACHCCGWSSSAYSMTGGGTSEGGTLVFKGGVNEV